MAPSPLLHDKTASEWHGMEGSSESEQNPHAESVIIRRGWSTRQCRSPVARGGDASIATAQHDGDTGCYHTARKKPVWRPVCRSPGLHCPPATATGAGGRWCPSRTTGEEAKRGREEDAASRTAVGSTGTRKHIVRILSLSHAFSACVPNLSS